MAAIEWFHLVASLEWFLRTRSGYIQEDQRLRSNGSIWWLCWNGSARFDDGFVVVVVVVVATFEKINGCDRMVPFGGFDGMVPPHT